MNDRVLPSIATDRQFYTARGWLTRYALACGYVEIRGNDESGVRLEQISSNGTLRVSGTGQWIRNEGTSFHTDLTAARRAFMAFDHVGISARAAKEHVA